MCDKKHLNQDFPDLFFKITKKKYADSFIKKGEIKFNTPQYWVDKKIDLLEGSIASFPTLSLNLVDYIIRHYESNSLDLLALNDTTYVKNKNSMGIYCFCLYNLKHKCNHKSYRIENTYFRNFIKANSVEDFNSFSDDDKPYLIVILNPNVFFNKLYSKLCELGINKDSGFLYGNIKYQDLQGEKKYWVAEDIQGYEPPLELFIKETKFKVESEMRFVINNFSDEILEKFKSPIELGEIHSNLAYIRPLNYDCLTNGLPLPDILTNK